MTLKRHHVLLIVLALAAALSIAAIIEQRRVLAPADAALWFFDVGQGDASLILDASGTSILIDGGPDDAVLEGLASALPWWDRTIEKVVVTHLDADHYVGLFAVLRKYRVDEVWWTGVVPTTQTARRFAALVEEKGIPQKFVHAGDSLALAGGRRLDVLFPFDDLRGALIGEARDGRGGTNDASVVLRFDCGDDEALYMGDASDAVEARLLDAGAPVEAEVLKIGHHGSAHSTSEAFLDAVDPEYAIIPSGTRNRYGHPAPRVLAALLERDIATLRTDREGSIRFACDGAGLHRSAARRWWRL